MIIYKLFRYIQIVYYYSFPSIKGDGYLSKCCIHFGIRMRKSYITVLQFIHYGALSKILKISESHHKIKVISPISYNMAHHYNKKQHKQLNHKILQAVYKCFPDMNVYA